MKLEELSDLALRLKNRNNAAYQFFENIVVDLTDPKSRNEAVERLTNCFSITQYANFTAEEEKILAEIIDSI